MKIVFLSIIISAFFCNANAQTALDTSAAGSSVIIQDSRIEILGEKLQDHNAAIAASNAASATPIAKATITTTSTGIVLTQGYRLMIISTNDRDLAMKVRAKLYQSFPDQKQYMEFQMPNTKIKLGNFIDRGQAEKVRKQIILLHIV